MMKYQFRCKNVGRSEPALKTIHTRVFYISPILFAMQTDAVGVDDALAAFNWPKMGARQAIY